jgi:hypothetical protein
MIRARQLDGRDPGGIGIQNDLVDLAEFLRGVDVHDGDRSGSRH